MPVRHSVRPSPIFLAIVGLTVFGGVLAWLAGNERSGLAYAGVFILVIAGWVVSLCLHEFGHAFTAWRFGDRGAAIRGYLDLDPRRYSNPMLSLGLPLLIIALGGIGLPGAAVYLRTSYMSAKQRTLVSLAGPAANLLIGAVLLVVIRSFIDPDHLALWCGIAFLAFLQVTAVLLNLLPIPGLDGYSALEPHLSPETQRAVEPAKQFGWLIVLVIFIAPALNQWFFGLVFWFYELSGVPAILAGQGMHLTQFWHLWF
jgi:Zn-dependent protease